MSISNEFKNVFMPSDTNGTGFWRALMAIEMSWAFSPEESKVNNSVICKLVENENFYRDLNMFMVQRLLANGHEAVFNELIARYSNLFGFWTVFNIDDLTDGQKIPLYNRGRRAFANKKHQENIRAMMNNSDFILTTTEYLKNEFRKTYDIPAENIICIPNLLPRWWIGNYYNNEKATENFRNNKTGNHGKTKNKIRIGIISSMSHYNFIKLKVTKSGQVIYPETEEVDSLEPDKLGKEKKVVYYVDNYETGEISTVSEEEYKAADNIPDDFDTVLDVIEKTIDDFTWVFVGYIPERLRPYAEQKKIEVYSCVNIMNYPAMISQLQLNAILAPLISDSDFNKSKTHIKYLEACALGILLYAPDMITYSPYMPKDQLYSSQDDLYEKLRKLKDMSANVFSKKLETQWRWLNSPTVESNWRLNNWWLEDNMWLWFKLFRMQKKAIPVSVKKYCEIQRKKLQKDAENAQIMLARQKDLEALKKINDAKVVIFEDKENDIEIAV